MKLHPSFTLASIAEMVNGRVIGDPNALVTGINEIHRVESGDLTFVDHPKYYDKALQSAATFVLINKEVEAPAGKGLIFSDDPFRDYVYLTRKFMPFVPSTSAIDPSAKIGKGTIIQPNVSIGPNVVIGENCIIHSGVVIYSHCVLGNNVIVHANSVLGADAFYFKRRPDFYEKMHSCGRVVLHDDVEIGASTTIDRGAMSNTIIGNGTKIDNQVQIAHNVVVGNCCVIAGCAAISGSTKIGNFCIIGGAANFAGHLTIADRTTVSGNTSIIRSITEPGQHYIDGEQCPSDHLDRRCAGRRFAHRGRELPLRGH